MATYGFSNVTGFNSPTFDELLLDLQAKFFAESGQLVDLEQPTPSLDLLRTLAATLKDVYDDMAGTYASAFVGSSSGVALSNLLSPFIGPPLAASASVVSLTLNGTPATSITAGAAVTLNSDGTNATSWVIVTPVVIGGGGTVVADFAYAEDGPKAAVAGSAWAIATPIAGWASVDVSATDAAQGRLAETEAEYRLRYYVSIQSRRILGAVLAVPGVTSAAIFENRTDIPDAEWGATHWIEVLVEGGADADIAAAIQANRTDGSQTVGTVTQATPATGYPGGSVSVRFSRPALIDVYIELTVVKGEGYSLDTSPAAITAREDAIKDQLVAWGASRPVGLDLTAFQAATIAAQTPGVPGIGDITPALVGTTPAPVTTSVVASDHELLVISAVNITLTGV